MAIDYENFIGALSWTLIHSLWQGLLLAAAGALCLIILRKAPATLRYTVLCSLLCLFTAAVAYTFFLQMEVVADGTVLSHHPGQMVQGENALKQAFSNNLFNAATDFIDRNVFWIAVAWFGLFCLKSFGLFRQLRKLYRIKNHLTNPVTKEWADTLFALKDKMGITKGVAFLESKLVTVPCTAGFLKPVILVPAGLLTSLPYDQIEAILLHELAHIKRRDFLVNLLQTFIETLFFFNPALLWLSSVIREERENCCDDIALSISQDRPSLVKALLSISQGTAANTLSVAFPGRRNLVLKRAQRIVGVNSAMINRLEKSVLSVSIAIFAIAVIACTADREKKAETPLAQMEDLPKDFTAFDRDLQKDMILQGIISDTTGMSYRLSNENFIVNGELQPLEVHQKFKAKYLRYKNMTATFYNWKFDE